MMGIPEPLARKIETYLDDIKKHWKEGAFITLIVRTPFLDKQGMDGDLLITDENDLNDVIKAIQKRIDKEGATNDHT